MTIEFVCNYNTNNNNLVIINNKTKRKLNPLNILYNCNQYKKKDIINYVYMYM